MKSHGPGPSQNCLIFDWMLSETIPNQGAYYISLVGLPHQCLLDPADTDKGDLCRQHARRSSIYNIPYQIFRRVAHKRKRRNAMNFQIGMSKIMLEMDGNGCYREISATRWQLSIVGSSCTLWHWRAITIQRVFKNLPELCKKKYELPANLSHIVGTKHPCLPISHLGSMIFHNLRTISSSLGCESAKDPWIRSVQWVTHVDTTNINPKGHICNISANITSWCWTYMDMITHQYLGRSCIPCLHLPACPDSVDERRPTTAIQVYWLKDFLQQQEEFYQQTYGVFSIQQ